MTSSTSPSNPVWPREAVGYLAVAVAAWLLSALYSLFAHPEVVFARESARIKLNWARFLDEKFPNKVVIYGGSSCNTAIDGQRLLDRHQLPVANFGLGAGNGVRVLTEFARRPLRAGDTLIVALEPDLLVKPIELDPYGVKLAFALGQPALLGNVRLRDWPGVLLDLRPGGLHVVTRLTRLLVRQPFRYSLAQMHPSGWHEIPVREPFPSKADSPDHLSPDCRRWLQDLTAWCRPRQIRIAYSIPWMYAAPADADHLRQCNQRILQEIAAIMPVLPDPTLGVITNQELFADTPLHPTAAGAALRSDTLAAALRAAELTPALQ
jgi:hypothetical protein